MAEVVSEMEYLRAREQKLRDTNESTNERVKWFAFGTMGMLVGLGAWQVVYLRAYFRYVSFLVGIVFVGLVGGVTDGLVSQIQASHLISTLFLSLGLRAGWRKSKKKAA